MKFNQLIKDITKRQEKYAKEKERNWRSGEKSLKTYLRMKKKHGSIQEKLSSRISFLKTKLGEGTKDHPLLCPHDHCGWWRKEFFAFKPEKEKKKTEEEDEED